MLGGEVRDECASGASKRLQLGFVELGKVADVAVACLQNGLELGTELLVFCGRLHEADYIEPTFALAGCGWGSGVSNPPVRKRHGLLGARGRDAGQAQHAHQLLVSDFAETETLECAHHRLKLVD